MQAPPAATFTGTRASRYAAKDVALIATAEFPRHLTGIRGERPVSARDHLRQRSAHLTQGCPVDATLLAANTLLSKAEDRLRYLNSVIRQKEQNIPVKRKGKQIADYVKERADLISQACESGEAIIRSTAPWTEQATDTINSAYAILRNRVGDWQRAAYRQPQPLLQQPLVPPPRQRSSSIGNPPTIPSAGRQPLPTIAQPPPQHLPPPPPPPQAGLSLIVDANTGVRHFAISEQDNVMLAGRELANVTADACNALLKLVIEKDNANPRPPATEDTTATQVIAEVYKNGANIAQEERQALVTLNQIGTKRRRLLAALVLTGGINQEHLREFVTNYHQNQVFRPDFEKFLDKAQKDLSQEVRSIRSLTKKIPTALLEPEALHGILCHMCVGKPALERAVLMKTSKFPTRGETHTVNKQIKHNHSPTPLWKRMLKNITNFFSGGSNGVIGSIIFTALTPLFAVPVVGTVLGIICASCAALLFGIWLVRKIHTAWQKSRAM